MAAIDKLYLYSYHDLAELKKWALIYYPKLFSYFYEDALDLDSKKFNSLKLKNAKYWQKTYKEQWEKMSYNNTISAAVAYLMSEYDLSEDVALDEATEACINSKKTLEDCKENISIAVMNTPPQVDKILKWICPIPCIRYYLQENCGVKERWYYKIFWKGKKRFM